MTATSAPRRLLLILAGVAGVVLAHAADYAALFPDEPARTRHLAATGHGYWPVAATLGLVAGVGAVAASAALGLAPSRRRRPPRTGRGRGRRPPRWAALAGWQVGLFAAMELLERAWAGVTPTTLLHSPEFGLGLVLQVVVAAALFVVLALVERLGAKVVTSLRRRVARTHRALWLSPLSTWPPARRGRSLLRSRAPPLLEP